MDRVTGNYVSTGLSSLIDAGRFAAVTESAYGYSAMLSLRRIKGAAERMR